MAFSPPFTPLQSVPGEHTGQLRLASIGGGIALYRGVTESVSDGYQTVLSPTVITPNPSFPAKVGQLLGTPPAYDVAPTPEGALGVASEMFGGATNALLVSVEVKDGPPATTALYQDLHDYTCPRFLRGSGVEPGQQFPTAVVGRSVFVAMTERPIEPSKVTPQSAPFRPLTDAADGLIASAVAIADGAPPPAPITGAGGGRPAAFPPVTALFMLAQMTGVPPAPSGDLPGILRVKAAGKTQALLPPDTPAFAFDVDARSGAALVLVSTPSGPQLRGYNTRSNQVTPIDWPPGYLPPEMSWIASPTVLAVPSESLGAKPFSFAFYAGGADRRVIGIRYGQVDLATLP